MKRADYFDAILASVPSDATAARVTGKGEHWNPLKAAKAHHLHSETPLPMCPIPVNDGTRGLAGARFGRLTVLGKYLGEKGKQTGGRYVVRCACGDYEVRSAKTIRQADPRSMCDECDYLEQVKQGNHKKRAWKIGTDGKVAIQGGAA